MLVNLEGPPLKFLYSPRRVEKLMLVNLEGPPLKSSKFENTEKWRIIFK